MMELVILVAGVLVGLAIPSIMGLRRSRARYLAERELTVKEQAEELRDQEFDLQDLRDTCHQLRGIRDQKIEVDRKFILLTHELKERQTDMLQMANALEALTQKHNHLKETSQEDLEAEMDNSAEHKNRADALRVRFDNSERELASAQLWNQKLTDANVELRAREDTYRERIKSVTDNSVTATRKLQQELAHLAKDHDEIQVELAKSQRELQHEQDNRDRLEGALKASNRNSVLTSKVIDRVRLALDEHDNPTQTYADDDDDLDLLQELFEEMDKTREPLVDDGSLAFQDVPLPRQKPIKLHQLQWPIMDGVKRRMGENADASCPENNFLRRGVD